MFGFAPVFSIHSFSSSILSYACQSFFFFSSAFPPHLVSYCHFGISPFFCPPNPFLNLLIRPHTLFCLPSFFFFPLTLLSAFYSFFWPTVIFSVLFFPQSFFFCVQLLSVLFCCSFLTFHSSFSLHFFSDCFSSTFQWDSPLSSLLSCHFLSHHCKYPVFAIPM